MWFGRHLGGGCGGRRVVRSLHGVRALRRPDSSIERPASSPHVFGRRPQAPGALCYRVRGYKHVPARFIVWTACSALASLLTSSEIDFDEGGASNTSMRVMCMRTV